jgi:DNA-binding transcriptional LysR family regulator
MRLPVYLIWRRARHRSPAAGAFIEFVGSAAASLKT